MEGAAVRVALLGAESTGKTVLSQALTAHLRAQGQDVTLVAEVLREWCDIQGRTPRPEEQMGIAQEQARRADAAATRWLVADTAPLMIAVYSDMLFGDTSLYPFALDHQRGYDLTLVTGLDLPWVADHLRDGPHVRDRVDNLVRAALEGAGIGYRVVYGSGGERLSQALAAINLLAPEAMQVRAAGTWSCELCDDAGCEHRLFTRLIG